MLTCCACLICCYKCSCVFAMPLCLSSMCFICDSSVFMCVHSFVCVTMRVYMNFMCFVRVRKLLCVRVCLIDGYVCCICFHMLLRCISVFVSVYIQFHKCLYASMCLICCGMCLHMVHVFHMCS